MTTLNKLANEAYIASQSGAIQAVINNVCGKTGLSYEQVTQPKTPFQEHARKALIIGLGKLSIPLWKIEQVSKTHYTECRRILQENRKSDYSIRTTNWEAFA